MSSFQLIVDIVMRNFCQKSWGVTLVELMISMALGLMISLACFQAFFTIKNIIMHQQGICRIQENAMILDAILGKAIHTVGSVGCNSLNHQVSIKVHPGINSDDMGGNRERLQGLRLKNLEENSKVPLFVFKRIHPHSDILWLKSVEPKTELKQPTHGEEGILIVKKNVSFKNNQIITISDCSHIDFMRVKNTTLSSDPSKIMVNLDKGMLSKHYDRHAQIGVLTSRLFYIGNTGRQTRTQYPVYALYSTDLNGRTLELVEGVEYFKVYYKVKSDDGYQYLTWEQVKDWADIIGIRLLILLTSVEDSLTSPQTYELMGKMVLPQDRLHRMWWWYEWPIKSL